MATKSKSYPQVKFPYEVINKAYNQFLKSIAPKNKKSLHRTWEVEFADTKWTLDSENQFVSEYVKDEIVEASILCFDLGDSKFRINFSSHSYEKPNTSVSISLSDQEKIEKVFNVFETSYSEFVEKSINISKEDNQSSQIAPRYNFDKKMPSLFVDKRLLVDLERYIVQRSSQLTVRKKQIPDYSVTIIDSSGTWSMQSIELYPREIFDNEIETVTLSYGSTYENIKIYLKFAKSKDSSEIEISYKGENAREVVESIKIGIFQRLKDSKTWNSIYYPHFAIIVVLIGVIVLSAQTTIVAYFQNGIWSQSGIAITLILVIYLVAQYFKPYTTFDTRRNITVRKWSGWLVESILGILLIWLVATLFPALVP